MTKEERLIKDGAGDDPVLFYSHRNANGKGSNFSPHGLFLPNPYSGETVWHLTGEHRYQAMKATNGPDYEHIRRSPTALISKNRGREIKLRPGWGDRYGDLCYYVMLETVLAKVRQNKDVAGWLKATGDRHIYEDSPVDDIWGWRYRDDYRGRNLLGRCLMSVRHIMWGPTP